MGSLEAVKLLTIRSRNKIVAVCIQTGLWVPWSNKWTSGM